MADGKSLMIVRLVTRLWHELPVHAVIDLWQTCDVPRMDLSEVIQFGSWIVLAATGLPQHRRRERRHLADCDTGACRAMSAHLVPLDAVDTAVLP